MHIPAEGDLTDVPDCLLLNMALHWAARQLIGRTAWGPPLPNAFAQLASLGAGTPTQHLLSQAATLQPISAYIPVQNFSSLPFGPATTFNLIGHNSHSAAFPGTCVGSTIGHHHISGGSGGKFSTTTGQSAVLSSPLAVKSADGSSGHSGPEGGSKKTASGLGSSAEAGSVPDTPAAAGLAEPPAGDTTDCHMLNSPLTSSPFN